MKNTKTPDQAWEPCHPGMIHEAAKESVSRRRLLQIALAVACIGIISSTTFFALLYGQDQPPVQDGLPGGIACITVHDHLIDFVSDRIEDKQLERNLASHLLKCRSCRTTYEEICCGDTSGCEKRPKKAYVRPCQHKLPAP